MRKNLATIVLMAGALLAIFSLTFHLHQTSKGKVLSQFNENQILIAQQVARQIESYFRSRFQELRWLSSLTSLQDPGKEKMAADIQSHFEYLKMIHVNEISLLDEKGTVAYSTTGGSIGKNHSQADFFSGARDPVNKGLVRIRYEKADGRRRPMTAGSPAPPHPRIFLVTPLYRESAGGGQQKPGGKFAGVLMYTVDLEKMLAERSVLFTPATKLHKLWIMDKDGTLLLQSEHPEMVMRSVRERDGTCNQCHASFDYMEKILGEAEGTIEYQIKGHPRKVAAFASMSFENTSWLVVVNAPLDEVTAFVQTNLKQTLFLLGILTFVLGLAFYFAYRNYRQKLDGEMEVKRLRDQQKLMEELRETRDYLENLFGYATAPIIVWDPEFKITRFNRAFERLTGYAAGEVIGRELQMFFSEGNREESLSLIARTLSGEYWESVEIPILCKDGGIRIALWNSANIYADDNSTLVATIAQGQDITERKQQTTELIRSNREKALLLKEIHHRVKNNLQIIASLLRLSSKYSGDERVDEIFQESQDRIRAMAAVHSMLYKSESLAEMNFGEYIRETARQLFRSYSTNPEAISLLINVEDVMLSIDSAIPCGLIINELVSNALKHALTDGRSGEIKVEMNQDENGVRIIFEDNGAGFPEGIDFRNTETLGLQLVNMLVAQLDGTIEMVRNGGTRYVITLKT